MLSHHPPHTTCSSVRYSCDKNILMSIGKYCCVDHVLPSLAPRIGKAVAELTLGIFFTETANKYRAGFRRHGVSFEEVTAAGKHWRALLEPPRKSEPKQDLK